jgi:cytochrome c biogenesis protein CcmG/thiol:disulfide interchange protein DsbE
MAARAELMQRAAPPAPSSTPPAARRSRALLLAPALIFAAVALMFAFALQRGDPSRIPSALIGKPAPAIHLPGLDGLTVNGQAAPGFDTRELANGKVSIVNFWASWCAPCVQEHPLLTELAAESGATLIGINYKDQSANARRFLGRYGNPFAVVAADADGRAAIEWGVYGMPETFIVDGRGTITYKHIGPISPASLQSKLLPAIEAAKRG